MKVMVVVPTYNERQNIEELAPKVLSQLPDAELLIVDDGSPDGTGEYADGLAERDPRVHVLHRPGKMGLGSAYVKGFKYALGTKADLVIQMDADFSHDPNVIPDLVEKMGEYDVVIGSRYITGANVVNWPLRRLFLSYFANVYTHIATAATRSRSRSTSGAGERASRCARSPSSSSTGTPARRRCPGGSYGKRCGWFGA